MWGLGAIVVALLLVLGVITAVIAAGYPGAPEPEDSPTGILVLGDDAGGFPYCELSSMENNRGGALPCQWKGESLETPANLPPGEYGMVVSITHEDDDGADFYGFHLLVENNG